MLRSDIELRWRRAGWQICQIKHYGNLWNNTIVGPMRLIESHDWVISYNIIAKLCSIYLLHYFPPKPSSALYILYLYCLSFKPSCIIHTLHLQFFVFKSSFSEPNYAFLYLPRFSPIANLYPTYFILLLLSYQTNLYLIYSTFILFFS